VKKHQTRNRSNPIRLRILPEYIRSSLRIISNHEQFNPAAAAGVITLREGSFSESSEENCSSSVTVPVFLQSASAHAHIQAHTFIQLSVFAQPIPLDSFTADSPEFIEVEGEGEEGAGGGEGEGERDREGGEELEINRRGATVRIIVASCETEGSRESIAEIINDSTTAKEHSQVVGEEEGCSVPNHEEEDSHIAIAIPEEGPLDYTDHSIEARLRLYRSSEHIQALEQAYQVHKEQQRILRRERTNRQIEELDQRAQRGVIRSAVVLILLVAAAIAIILLTKAS